MMSSAAGGRGDKEGSGLAPGPVFHHPETLKWKILHSMSETPTGTVGS
jgi:hypothetical protein